MQQARRIYGAASGLALVAVVTAACSGTGAKTLTRAGYVAQADAICRAAEAQIAHLTPVGAHPSPGRAVTFTGHLLAILPRAVGRLASLKAPAAATGVLDKNLLAPERAVDVARQMFLDNEQEANGDVATEEAALDYFVSVSTDPNQVAENQALATFGFGACSQLAAGPLPASVATPPPPTTTTPSPPTTASPTSPTTASPTTASPTTASPSTASPTTATTAPPPAPGPFVATDAGFSAVFPATPTRRQSPLDEAGVTLQKIFYNTATADEDVSVTYVLHPSAPTAANIPAVLVNSIDQAATAIAGTVTSMAAITYLGSPAEDAVITTPDQVDHLRVLIVGPKFYVLQGFVAVTTGAHPHYDELLATFHTIQ